MDKHYNGSWAPTNIDPCRRTFSTLSSKKYISGYLYLRHSHRHYNVDPSTGRIDPSASNDAGALNVEYTQTEKPDSETILLAAEACGLALMPPPTQSILANSLDGPGRVFFFFFLRFFLLRLLRAGGRGGGGGGGGRGGEVHLLFGIHPITQTSVQTFKHSNSPASYCQAIRSSSTMLTCFIIILVLWHLARPTSADITDAEYRSYAQSLREYRYGITNMKHNLEVKLNDLYLKWKDPDDPYGSGIDSITELWIPHIIPSYIPVTEKPLREPVEGNSQSHNEFVWEVLDNLFYFTYFSDDCPVEDVHREELEDQLRAQIHLALGGSHDVFYDICPDSFNIFHLNDRIARVNEALMSGAIPVVSSLRQNLFNHLIITHITVSISTMHVYLLRKLPFTFLLSLDT
ncbi:hypothetical protein SeLEV6574_g02246 [Synchytrium endobioticum]|uniref:Uncharacterized protein n=1 Tax=Synchytrium endobioticum TaxID=286115 RepID=A0A507D998_9FUNG|nr:hypothetical protein SeLEV6574_g02246 [Synchytrium endobioticum]